MIHNYLNMSLILMFKRLFFVSIILNGLISYAYSQRSRFLTEDDYQNAEKLSDSEVDHGVGKIRVEAEFNPKFYGGDIVDKPAKRKQDVHGYITKSSGRHWPNARVPYEFFDYFTSEEKAHIARAFSYFHNKTCIRFVAKTAEDKSYLELMKGDGCYSEELGRIKKRPQEVSLSADCMRVDIIIHELMHAIGFMHEFSRPDRDQYIDIEYDNIDSDPGARNQFQKLSGNLFGDWDLPFDVKSAMFYESTMGAKEPNLEVMKAKTGQELRCKPHLCPTELDVLKINTVYGCKNYTKLKTDSTAPTKTCVSLEWIAKSDSETNNALVVRRKSKGIERYVCRAKIFNGEFKSGETDGQKNQCLITTTSGFRFEWYYDDYELLSNPENIKLKWTDIHNSNSDTNSVIVGRSSDGISYVTKCKEPKLLFGHLSYCARTQILKC